jgi:hypothetical protein
MTRNLKLFMLFSVVWSVPFFAVLEWMLQNPNTRGPLMPFASIAYGIGFSIAGRYFGRKEDKVSRAPIGLRYGLFAGLIASAMGLLWALIWHRDHVSYIVSYLIAISLCFVIYFVLAKLTYKGITKKELFK